MKKLILTLATVCLSSLAHAEEKKLDITGNDQMQYSTKTLEVTAGDKVTVTLKHIGALPKTAMGHNFVLLKPGVAAPTFATKAITAGAANDYIPQDEDSKKEVIAHTKLVGGGESDSVTFDAPEAGTYTYICTFPGHFAMMTGTLTVKAK